MAWATHLWRRRIGTQAVSNTQTLNSAYFSHFIGNDLTLPSLITLKQVPDVAEAMDLGLKAATLISQKFPPPVKLEFEKV